MPFFPNLISEFPVPDKVITPPLLFLPFIAIPTAFSFAILIFPLLLIVTLEFAIPLLFSA